MWAALIPVAISIVRALEGSFGKGKGPAKASTAAQMVDAAIGGLKASGEIDQSASVDTGAVIEMVVQILKERGDLGGVKTAPPKDQGDNPPLTMPMPSGAVLTVQF